MINDFDTAVIDFKGQTCTWINTVLGIAKRMKNVIVTEVEYNVYRFESDGDTLQYLTCMISLSDGGDILDLETEGEKEFYNERSEKY